MDRPPTTSHTKNEDFVPTVTRRGDYVERTYLKKDGKIGKILTLAKDALQKKSKSKGRDSSNIWATVQQRTATTPEIKHVQPPWLKDSVDRELQDVEPKSSESEEKEAKREQLLRPSAENLGAISDTFFKKLPSPPRKLTPFERRMEEEPLTPTRTPVKHSPPKMFLGQKHLDVGKPSETPTSAVVSFDDIPIKSSRPLDLGVEKVKTKIFDTKKTSPLPQSVKHMVETATNMDISRCIEYVQTMTKELSTLEIPTHELLEQCAKGLDSNIIKDPKQCENLVKTMKTEIINLQEIFREFLDICLETDSLPTKGCAVDDRPLPTMKKMMQAHRPPRKEKPTQFGGSKIDKCQDFEDKILANVDLTPSELLKYVSECQGPSLPPSSRSPAKGLPEPSLSFKPSDTSLRQPKVAKKKRSKQDLAIVKKPTRDTYTPLSKRDTDCHKRYKTLKLQRPPPMDRIFQFMRECCFDVFKGPENQQQLAPTKLPALPSPTLRKSGGQEEIESSSSVTPKSSSSLSNRRKYYPRKLRNVVSYSKQHRYSSNKRVYRRKINNDSDDETLKFYLKRIPRRSLYLFEK